MHWTRRTEDRAHQHVPHSITDKTARDKTAHLGQHSSRKILTLIGNKSQTVHFLTQTQKSQDWRQHNIWLSSVSFFCILEWDKRWKVNLKAASCPVSLCSPGMHFHFTGNRQRFFGRPAVVVVVPDTPTSPSPSRRARGPTLKSRQLALHTAKGNRRE